MLSDGIMLVKKIGLSVKVLPDHKLNPFIMNLFQRGSCCICSQWAEPHRPCLRHPLGTVALRPFPFTWILAWMPLFHSDIWKEYSWQSSFFLMFIPSRTTCLAKVTEQHMKNQRIAVSCVLRKGYVLSVDLLDPVKALNWTTDKSLPIFIDFISLKHNFVSSRL